MVRVRVSQHNKKPNSNSAVWLFSIDHKCVNIFRQQIYRVTSSLSTLCKTYCFTKQKRRFCTVKAAVLPCKRAAFATSNRNYHFSYK
ncbi:hypothetical protein CTM55_03435 [Prevotella intermedia]|nr:hypothetical protein CTM55_03435 [Prevotella intermedia]